MSSALPKLADRPRHPARPTRPPEPEPKELDGAACRPWNGSHDARRPHEPTDQWKTRLAEARRICGTCPVIAACRQLREHYQGRRNGIDGILAGRPTVAPAYNRREKR